MARKYLGVAPSNAPDLIRKADLDAAMPPGWSTYTPTWLQGATNITKTINLAEYKQDSSKWVTASVILTATGAGTANQVFTVSLPVAAANSFARGIGSFFFNDSGSGYYSGAAIIIGSTTAISFQYGQLSSNQMGGTLGGFTAAIASGDFIGFTIGYRGV